MNGMYASPMRFSVGDAPNVMCEAIKNVFFNNIHSRGLAFPWIEGRKDVFIENVTFSNCSFEKLSDEDLPDYKHHGAASWDRPLTQPMFRFTKNIMVNNTSFWSK